VTLGDSIAWALPDLRVQAESTMTATATITRPTGFAFNPGTGLSEETSTTVVSETPARLRQPTAVEANVMFGEQDVTRVRFIVDFPWTVTGVQIGDVVTFTDSDDPEMIGAAVKVVGMSMRNHQVTRSYGCEVVA
jgi:hypothetical protein